MQLLAFRIERFRSIVDTGWINCSNDNLTVLVGQNESGKTAILSALAATFSQHSMNMEDVRHGEEFPTVSVRSQFSEQEWTTAAQQIKSKDMRNALIAEMKRLNGITEWRFENARAEEDQANLDTTYHFEKPDFESILSDYLENPQNRKNDSFVIAVEKSYSENEAASVLASAKNSINREVQLALLTDSVTEFQVALFAIAPRMTLFRESAGLLPNKIDIEENFTLAQTPGSAAARNFLSAANINLKALVGSGSIGRAAILKAANRKISEGFLKFWSQTLGKTSSMQIECVISQHDYSHEKPGRPFLEFFIVDNAGPLYPAQRSQGTRWFISFFLQMSASEHSNNAKFYLIDEPGANLHEKAQKDVLSFLEKIKYKIGIIYSTHIPHLLEEKALHRVIAVERDFNDDLHPTKVIGSHALGAASTDTLSPIFSAMGANFSRQNTIKKNNNVLLEELSCLYYLKAFWKLTGCEQEVNFLPATGTSNVPVFANLLLGWGLDFVIVVDDEASGRSVFNKLKRDMFLDDEEWSRSRMYKIKDCEGIEDIFSTFDYKNVVLGKPDQQIEKGNAKWAKANGAAKAIHALKFLHKVEDGFLEISQLQDETTDRIQTLVSHIENMLKNYASRPADF
jgi:predicted ATP-dependent endonuclease of OLD family